MSQQQQAVQSVLNQQVNQQASDNPVFSRSASGSNIPARLRDFSGVDTSFLDLLNTLQGTALFEEVLTPTAKTPNDSGLYSESEESGTEFKTLKATVTKAQSDTSQVPDINPSQINKELDRLEVVLSPKDASFFQNVVLNGLPFQGSVPVQQVFQMNAKGDIQFGDQQLSIEMAEKLKKAYGKNQPLRVALNDDTSVVLKFKNGQVSAEFLTQDAAASTYIKQYLDELRYKVAQKGLPVADLTHKQQKQEKNQQQHQSQG